MLLRYWLKALALPPVVNLLLILLALLLLRRWPRLRNGVIALSAFSLLLLCLPVTSNWLAAQIEVYPPLEMREIDPSDYDAIVILGGGRHSFAMEYDGLDIPRGLVLERLRYGALLQRKTGLPILVTGGKVLTDQRSEAELMAEVLERDLYASVFWQERESKTTWENATKTQAMAVAKRVLLVTHAWHMQRAMYSFSQAGFEATAAPTIYYSNNFQLHTQPLRSVDFIPNPRSLYKSYQILHEWMGLLWYQNSGSQATGG